nr:MAG TPA: hypothetical protein [Caudoviricetes sp.]
MTLFNRFNLVIIVMFNSSCILNYLSILVVDLSGVIICNSRILICLNAIEVFIEISVFSRCRSKCLINYLVELILNNILKLQIKHIEESI